MAVHDWTLVDSGIFHSFHTTWIGQINSALNSGGLLPKGYYALAEQYAGEAIADVLTLHVNQPDKGRSSTRSTDDVNGNGGTLVAETPPRVRRRQSVENPAVIRPRAIAIRHVSGHELVALIEIVSPGNKDRAQHVQAFADKAAEALGLGIHLLMVDLFPPGRFDPYGIHGAIRQRLTRSADDPYDLPREEPLTLAAYAAGLRIEMYIEHLAVGAPLPEMQLFLRRDRYINVPLESTYHAAYLGMPAVWRDVLEGREPRPS
jgi:hypothetical protein